MDIRKRLKNLEARNGNGVRFIVVTDPTQDREPADVTFTLAIGEKDMIDRIRDAEPEDE